MSRSTSFWLHSAPRATHPPLTSDARADVCVIGAGIAGLTTAYLLATAGRSVIVIDARSSGGGQTGVTTAHLSSVIDDTFREMHRLHGEDGARMAHLSHRAAIDRIEEISQHERIACRFERVSGYLFLAPEHDRRELDEEFEAARRAGVEVERLDNAAVNGIRTGPCLHFPRQGQFHPLRYLDGLVKAIERTGGRICGGTRAETVTGGSPARVAVAGGPTIEAEAVVVATNSPFNDTVAIHTKQAPYYTYAIAARTPAGAITPALYWDTADPYHYVRLEHVTNAELGGDNDQPVDLLIVGGEDHKTGQAQDAEARYERLEAWMRARFIAAGEVEFRWSGQVMESQDGLGFIGRNPLDAPNVYVATGDSGMGMTHGTIAGILLSDMILDRPTPWRGLYDPSRVRVGAAGEFVKENLNVASQYSAYVTAGEVASVDEIVPNTGAVVRDGLRKVAVFRDEAGELHRYSAICPHMGCIVAWNAAASTWDCPCHGSRFDSRGGLVSGPASSPLRRMTPDG